jgi:hypothetical protein
MSLTATARSIPGTLRQEVVVDGQHRLITDEPEHLGERIEYDHRSTPRRFDVRGELGGELTEEQLRRLEKVAASCPVRRAVESGIEFHDHVEGFTSTALTVR